MAEKARQTLHPEDEISHYRIVSPLGAGGMGEVYLAEDKTLGRNVALKILPLDLVRNEDRVRRFEFEARSASQLSHPNIVTIYEIGRHPVRSAGAPDSEPLHYIAMEVVSGKTLGSLIHEERADLRTLLGYLAQAAEGLAKAHAAGIVHRDLKPGNLMVSADGFTKVLDFGLAKLTERSGGAADLAGSPTLTAGSEVGSIVGTAGYMSPEQVAGRPVDTRSDIFSFGCVLYEAATRREPFAASTGVETMHKILNEKPVPVEELNDKAPAELRRLIRRCLAKSPDQRVQSIKDLALELREIVEEYDALSASASSASSIAGAPPAVPPRRRIATPAFAAVALLGVAGLAFGLWALFGKRSAPPPAAFATMRMSTQTSRGDVADATLSPDGRYLAYVAGRSGPTGLRVRQVATGSDVEVLPVSEDGVEFPAFSPDGNYLFYLSRKPDNRQYRALFSVPSLGGTPREILFDVDSRVTFSPDGKQVAFWRGVPQKQQNLLVVFDLASARERVLATLEEAERFQGPPAWSPDGRTLAVLLDQPLPTLGVQIVLFEAETGSRRRFLELPRFLLSSLAWLPDGRGLIAAGLNLKVSLQEQIHLITYPDGRLQPVTNDFQRYFSVSVSGGETATAAGSAMAASPAIAAVRQTRLANLWLADAAGGAPRPLTSITSPERSPMKFSVAGAEQVIFDAPQDPTLQIWTVGAAGGEPRALTAGSDHSANALGASNVIVFDRLEESGAHVWRIDPDGTGLRQLTQGSGEQLAALSPDGRFVAIERWESPRKIELLELATGALSTLATDASSVLGFSPDSSHLLIGQLEADERGLARTLWRAVPIAGGAPTVEFRLPPSAFRQVPGPDGKSLTFLNRTDPAWNVYRLRAAGSPGSDTGEPAQVTRFDQGRLTGHGWSPDGSRLAVSRRTEAGDSLWVTAPDGSGPVELANFPAQDIFSAHWLPDSRRIAISAGKSSRDAVLIRDFR